MIGLRWVWFACLLAGCSATTTISALPVARPRPTSNPATHPAYLLHLPGIGGTRSIDQSVLTGIREGGFVGRIDIEDWTSGHPGLDSLAFVDVNRRHAQRIADKLTALFDADPNLDIHVTSHSGGGGIAIWTLEALPPRVKVADLLMIAPALSPSYDLSRALTHVRRKAYVFTSVYDDVVLGLGCRTMGTIDRVYTDAAGRVGFTPTPGVDHDQYRKLVQLPYRPAWKRFYDTGDHISAMTYPFGYRIFAPLFRTGKLPDILFSPGTAPQMSGTQ